MAHALYTDTNDSTPIAMMRTLYTDTNDTCSLYRYQRHIPIPMTYTLYTDTNDTYIHTYIHIYIHTYIHTYIRMTHTHSIPILIHGTVVLY